MNVLYKDLLDGDTLNSAYTDRNKLLINKKIDKMIQNITGYVLSVVL